MPISNEVSVVQEWILGPEDTPFFTTRWYPTNTAPKAYTLFVHGHAEHISRYDHFFRLLAAPPSSIHIMAFDQRGFGRTAGETLSPDSGDVKRWEAEGKAVRIEKNGKRKTGGWAKVMPDIEWFVKREKDRAGSKKLFLHGFSMGGGQVLGFATRPAVPPSPETIGLLAGVIAGGPMIRLTEAQPWLKLKIGAVAASFLPNTVIPTPINYKALSHNQESNERARADALCEQTGSLRQMADMINNGMALDSSAAWDAWPARLPLLLYHGDEDSICDIKATTRFAENCKAKDKRMEPIKGMYHEVHNEFEPVPTQVALIIREWIHARMGDLIQPETAYGMLRTISSAVSGSQERQVLADKNLMDEAATVRHAGDSKL